MIERASPIDLMQLASEVPGVPMVVAAVLTLAPGSAVQLGPVQAAIANRIGSVPRLRQRLIRAPLGCGRPFWTDDPGFDIGNHVRSVRCAAPGDEPSLLRVAADTMTQPLQRNRPLWSATLVTGLAGGGAALIVALHHVLADGVGGLAVLGRLIDGAAGEAPVAFPRRRPGHRELLVDSLRSRLRAVGRLPARVGRLPLAVAELAPRTVRPSRSSLNRPTGPDRTVAVARADLAAVRAAGHAHGATVNDVVLTAVAGALHKVLRLRGESADRFVVSVPISARRQAGAARLGNEVGVLRLAVPAIGDRLLRLEAIAHITNNARSATPGSSAALLAPLFRILAGLGAFRWFVDRQPFVTTLVTNLHGPETRLSFLGAPITGVIPVLNITGNITVAFGVLSYAGELVVTVVADPQRCPDLAALVQALQAELDVLALTPQ